MPVSSDLTILLVGDDDALAYLIERYAARGGLRLHVVATSTPGDPPAQGHAAVWFSSLEALEVVRPRETGLVGHDSPVLVCTSMGDESRARELGADYCVVQPLTFPDFMAAMTALSIVDGRAASAG